ncbi:MAG: hypothetical protein WDM96_07150 [Lacunisphaera sp.]
MTLRRGSPPCPTSRARLRALYGDKVIPATVMADLLADNKGRY